MTTLKQRDTPFNSAPIGIRNPRSRTSYVSVVVYHYVKQNFGTPSNIQSQSQIDQLTTEMKKVKIEILEEEVTSCTVSKSLSNPSSSFEFQILPSQNWKQKISPGDWVLIYIHGKSGQPKSQFLSKQGTKDLIMVGNIDRVARSLQKDEATDKTLLRYVVSGRNFGKVFEETGMWFNPTVVNQKELNEVTLASAGVPVTGTPDTMVKALTKVFLGLGGQLGDVKFADNKVWFIPSELSKLFGGSESRFYGILAQKITSNLPGYCPRMSFTAGSTGGLYDILSRSSNSIVNELFFEESRDSNGNVKPTMVLRPRPLNSIFFESNIPNKGALNGKYKKMQDLSTTDFIEISQSEILYENLGKDGHSRFNHFYLSTQNNFEFAFTDPQGTGKISNPTVSVPSIRRHGLKQFTANIDFCYALDSKGNPAPERALFEAFMGQVYDMNYANHLYDTGTIECTGVLEAELGKVLKILPEGKSLPKIYYIEGYEHSWKYPSTWRTTFSLSHGQFQTTDFNKTFIDASASDFGIPDDLLDRSYVAKTIVSK